MDMTYEILSLIKSRNTLPCVKDVIAKVSHRFDRMVHPNKDINGMITEIWIKKKSENSMLFNQSKFRLSNDPIVLNDGKIIFNIGLTDYKTYIGLNSISLQEQRKIQDDGTRLHNDPSAFLSNKIGIASIVETSDEKIIFFKRSSHVGVCCGLYDVPGGHPEPSNLNISISEKFSRDEGLEYEGMSELEENVVKELFNSAVAEIYDEINIPKSHLREPKLLGIVYQGVSKTPSIAFYVKCSLQASEVRKHYENGPTEAFESSELKMISSEELNSLDQESPEFTTSALGCLKLWHIWKET